MISVSICLWVCLSVCLSTCPQASIRNYMSKLYPIFCACFSWPWLSHPAAALQHVMYFRFMDDVMYSYYEHKGVYLPQQQRHCSVVHELTPILCDFGCALSWTMAMTTKSRRFLHDTSAAGAESAMHHCLVFIQQLN